MVCVYFIFYICHHLYEQLKCLDIQLEYLCGKKVNFVSCVGLKIKKNVSILLNHQGEEVANLYAKLKLENDTVFLEAFDVQNMLTKSIEISKIYNLFCSKKSIKCSISLVLS